MKPIKRIAIDLNRPRTNTVQLVQGDTARQIAVVLMLDGMPYDVSADTSDTIVMGVAYIKANGVGGYYEETTTGDDAVTAGDNAYTWIVSLDNHATDVPGMGEIFIRFSTADGLILHSFPVKLFIDRSSASGGTDPNAPYYQTNSFLIAGNQATKTAAMTTPVGVDANGKLWTEGGLSDEAKYALLACFEQVAWKTPYGQTYFSALETALFSEVHLVSITASYDQDHPIYITDSWSTVCTTIAYDLVVTASYSDGTSETLSASDYELSGTLSVGTNTVTVTYEGKTDTISVLVLEDPSVKYRLPTPFVSDGTNSIDTDVAFESNKKYTVYGEFTITSINRAVQSGKAADFVFGNRVGSDSDYVGLQIIEARTSPYNKYMWGVGIGYSAGEGLPVAGHKYRFVVVMDTSTAGCAMNLKDVTAGTTNTYNNTYSATAMLNNKEYYLGYGSGSTVAGGFNGTVSEFVIEEGEMSSSDITAYLEGS